MSLLRLGGTYQDLILPSLQSFPCFSIHYGKGHQEQKPSYDHELEQPTRSLEADVDEQAGMLNLERSTLPIYSQVFPGMCLLNNSDTVSQYTVLPLPVLPYHRSAFQFHVL